MPAPSELMLCHQIVSLSRGSGLLFADFRRSSPSCAYKSQCKKYHNISTNGHTYNIYSIESIYSHNCSGFRESEHIWITRQNFSTLLYTRLSCICVAVVFSFPLLLLHSAQCRISLVLSCHWSALLKLSYFAVRVNNARYTHIQTYKHT